MKTSELALRYAKALYALAAENKQQDMVFTQLRALSEVTFGDEQIHRFLASPLIRPSDKEAVFEQALKVADVSDSVKKFLLVLAKKNRLAFFDQILTAYQTIADEDHGMVRGEVRSAAVLAPEERQRIEEIVSRVTNKQALLTYKEDPQILGGLIAEVGSYTFDDSIQSHLRRMKEQLNRRTH